MISSNGFVLILLPLAAIFCIVTGARDLRANRWAWGAAGLVIGVSLLLVPIKTHAVKIDLPRSEGE